METHFERLSNAHLKILKDFNCETDVSTLKSKDRRKVKKHDKELSDFLIKEALREQEKCLTLLTYS